MIILFYFTFFFFHSPTTPIRILMFFLFFYSKQSRKLKMNRMYFFLVHLSIADLITGFFNVLPQLAWIVAGRFYGGDALCKSVKFLQMLGPYLSSYVLVMTSIDRFQAICNPLANNSVTKTHHRSRWLIGLAWLISMICCSPQVFIFSYVQINDNVYECWAQFPVCYLFSPFYVFCVCPICRFRLLVSKFSSAFNYVLIKEIGRKIVFHKIGYLFRVYFIQS